METPRDALPSGTPGGHTESVYSYPDDEGAVGAERPPTLPPGTVVAGRYRLIAEIGKGGYAIVYRARDERDDCDVALKILRADRLGTAALKRLAREAETAGTFSHPHLVRVLDHGRDGDHAFLAMELVEGETLRARIARGAMQPDDAVRIASEVLEALGALHGQGIVHRDVKPSNILLDAQGSAKLADFGLVTRWSDDQTRATRSEAIVGTLEYVSPEQALGEKLDGRSDLYAVGVVLYEMLSGAPLHGARSSLGMLVAHLTKPAPDIRASRESVPEWLAAVVARLLAKSRDERYADCAAVLADLGNRTPPHSPRLRPNRSNRLRPALVLVGVVLLGLAWQRRPDAPVPSRTPALTSAEVKGGVLRALDEKGNVLWTGDILGTLDDAAYSPAPPHQRSRLVVADIDDDGAKEVLIVPPPTDGTLDELFAFNADGSLRFRRTPGRPLTFGGESYDRYHTNSVHFLVDRNGARRLFVLSTHERWFPNFLEEIDARGRVLSEYVASGHQWSLLRVGFRGHDALALMGYHNETRGGSITFVSLDKPAGHAPSADPNFRCTNCRPGDPLAVLIFPRVDVLEATGGGEASAHVSQLIQVEGGQLDVTSEQGEAADSLGVIQKLRVSYNLSADGSRVMEVRPSNQLREAHDALFRSGRLDHPFGRRDMATLERVLTWDGHGWAPVPMAR